MIKDSGNRTAFESGAVRDIQEGKGRCDLLPLDVVAELLDDCVLQHVADFEDTGNKDSLLDALCYTNMFTDGYTMMLEVAKHFEEGADKYGERNWEKGIPVSRYIDSAIRHYLKHMHGDRDERHDRAFCWNLLCATWTCEHKPELNDFIRRRDNEQ